MGGKAPGVVPLDTSGHHSGRLGVRLRRRGILSPGRSQCEVYRRSRHRLPNMGENPTAEESPRLHTTIPWAMSRSAARSARCPSETLNSEWTPADSGASL